MGVSEVGPRARTSLPAACCSAVAPLGHTPTGLATARAVPLIVQCVRVESLDPTPLARAAGTDSSHHLYRLLARYGLTASPGFESPQTKGASD